MKRIPFILLLLLFSLRLVSQEFRHFDVIDGLSSIEVTSICENENFMWIATSDGLNRFDGRNFKIYKRENGKSNSLTENNIETLMFDSKGMLWIGLKTGGVDIYNPRTDKFVHLRDLIKGKCPYRVISIFEDSQQNIWIGSWEEGLFKLTPDKTRSGKYNATEFLSGYIISGFVEKPKGYIWIGTYFGYFLYDINKNQWIKTEFKNVAVTQFLDYGEKNALWCSTWSSGLLKIKWEGARPSNVTSVNKYKEKEFSSFFRLTQGTENNLYAGTWGDGLKIVNTTKEGTSAQSKINLDASLINCLYRDKYNNIWIATFGKGIYRFNPEKNGISKFPPSGKLPASAMSLSSIGNNQLIVGTQGNGVYQCNLSTNKLFPKSDVIKSNDVLNKYILSSYTNQHYTLVGHDGYGFLYAFRFEKNPSDISFQSFQADNQLEKITSFFETEDGRIWVGSKQNGLISVRPDRNSGKMMNYIHYDSFGRDEITGFAEFDKQHLWISSHNGLFLYNTQTNKIETNGEIISGEIVYSIAKSKTNDCLWIGTSTDLLKIEKTDALKIQSVFPADMLPHGAIKDLTIDSKDNVWFSIGGRIFCYLTSEKRIREINSSIFGYHTILSATRMMIDNREHIVFGGTDYLIVIDPQIALNRPNKTKILLTELQIDHHKVKVGEKINREVVLNQETEYTNSLKLSYKSKWISLAFTETGTDYYINRYQYRFKEFGDNWQQLDLSRPIMFSQLAPGSYILEIREFDGVNTQTVCWSMKIVVTPPWWKTGWFYFVLITAILITAGLGLLFVFQQLKKRQSKRLEEIENQNKQELLQEKESFFAGLSHDLLTPFSLIIAPANDLLRESREDDPNREKLEIIAKNASFLSDILNTILDFKRAETSNTKLNEKKTEIVSFSRLIFQSFSYLARSKNINLQFESDVKELNILIDHVKIERILYNLISNALKYTSDGGSVTVLLEYDRTNAALKYNIKDNGAGIERMNQSKVFEKFYREPKYEKDKTSKGFGLGLYVVKQFVGMLNGDISISSGVGSGTEIKITLPVTLIEKPIESNNKMQHLKVNKEDATTILVVEDNDELRKYLAEKLSAYFVVVAASNGAEAFQMLADYLPEIVISDVMMSEIDGYTLCRNIKENSLYADIFVILLTAKSSTDDELQGYKSGADIYIKKPFDSEALINQVINITQTRQNRRTQLLGKLISPDPNDIDFDPKDQFLQQSMKVIEAHFMDAEFKIDEFAEEMNVSKTVLHRKFRLLVGQTPNQFIRTIRLRKAVNLLLKSDLNISEIAYLTGFNQSHYFIKCFREVYNETPKSFRQQKKDKEHNNLS